MEPSFDLHPVDYVMFVGVLMVSSAIGLFFAFTGGKQKTTKEYLSGDRQLSMIPASLSMVVSYMSAISMLGDPAEAYLYGAVYIWNSVASCIGAVLANFIFIPIFYPLQLTSINKYFEMRFQSKIPKLLGTICGVLQCLTYTGVVIYAPSTAISLLTGLPTPTVVLVCAAVAVIYTTLGGLKAVIWTDVFQCVIMLAGMTTILVIATIGAGGLSDTFNYNREGGRLKIFNVSPDLTERVTMWNTLVGGSVLYSLVYGATQPAVVRYSGMKDITTARCSVFVVLVGNLVIYQLPLLAGLAMYAYYAHIRCDPIAGGLVDNANQLVPYFVMDMLSYPGVPGLFIASLCAGALSTVSSVLNAAAALAWDDVISPRWPHMEQWKATLVCKVIVVVLGAAAVGVSFVTMGLGGTVLQASISLNGSLGNVILTMPIVGVFCPWVNAKASLSLNGALGAAAFGMIVSGCFCPWINCIGAVTGSLVSTAFLMWIMMGSYTLQKFTTDKLPTITDMCNITALPPDNDTTSWFTNAMPTEQSVVETSGSLWNNGTNLVFESSQRSAVEYMYGISFFWYTFLGVIISVVVASIVSLFTGCTKSYMINPKLLVPCVRRCYMRRVRTKDISLSPLGEDLEDDPEIRQRFVQSYNRNVTY